ncbi:MAG: efflux RND transporter periplasmic adaptor subunit [Patescibacteria group bacterium]|nr:efflux RND transporter periplasmic adaptor subunit [Patescibacteria group bacterium]
MKSAARAKRSGTMPSIWVKAAAGAALFGAVVWGLIALLSRHPQSYATAAASKRDLVETVSADGIVKADQSVALAFSEQGLVAAVDVQVGDAVKKGAILASLDTGALQAGLAGAQADVLAAQASLAQAQKGTRAEELAIYSQKYADASSAFITAMKNAYLVTEDAILNKSDSVFSNGSTANPTISIRTQSAILQLSINNQRVAVGDALDSWKAAIDAISPDSTSTQAIDAARTAVDRSLSTVKSFIDSLGSIANDLSVGNSGLTQAAIDADVAAVNGAAQAITGAETSEQSAEAAWGSARDTLILEQAGSTPEAIQADQAAVAKAQAAVQSAQSQIAHAYITAPFDGVVTAADLKVGEVYVPGVSAGEDIGLMTAGALKAEAYVPETDIGKIAVGDAVSVTFDSYGPSQEFPATVSLIDPAATQENGANAYKVTAVFQGADPRILPGMSATLSIEAASSSGALAVPTSALIARGSSVFVLVKQPSGAFVQTQVRTGISTADGYTEILSGLSEGDVVASFGSSYQLD